MTRQPAQSLQAPGDTDPTWAMVSYLGMIFLGPLITVPVWLTRRQRSPFMRYHAARAVNLSLTAVLYGTCCLILFGLLVLDTVALGLAVAVPLLVILWLVTLKYAIRGFLAAQRGEPCDMPPWICATIVQP